MTKKTITLLISSVVIGLLVGVIFIFVQPLFGMSALTQRHAEGYMKLGSMSESTALVSAWFVHLFISACYGIASAIALLISRNALPYTLQIVFLGWITTVIAPPANAFLVKLIGTQSLPAISTLPALNFAFDAKLVLHLIFFAVIAISLWSYQRISTQL
ncbi:hypothetical protein [Arenicella xantha]|uniref:Uncharacterized protein n=1 Tax=Arenicella xantha TaxID=644221 RepID=A0A395JJY4_9GAMM|nr:hypothetical protein [Arenicella xantha]RBP51093.1 hypothetical protein DFR28_102512 [Arenicella xantha]